MAETRTVETKLKVFISYSRKDLAFAERLVAALEARGLAPKIDTRDLPDLQDWRRELLDFIRASDTVVFIVSPRSVSSPVCAWELSQVMALNKRLAPIVLERVEDDRVPEEIAKINYAHMRIFTKTLFGSGMSRNWRPRDGRMSECASMGLLCRGRRPSGPSRTWPGRLGAMWPMVQRELTRKCGAGPNDADGGNVLRGAQTGESSYGANDLDPGRVCCVHFGDCAGGFGASLLVGKTSSPPPLRLTADPTSS
jgi:hypothetical protein